MSLALTSAVISTSTTVSTSQGILTYLGAGEVALMAYDGTSSAGVLLSPCAAGTGRSFDSPVGFSDGLFVSVASTTGFGVAHTG